MVLLNVIVYFRPMLSKRSKYAINALVYLARQARVNEDRKVQISEISEAQSIPKKFLETILLDLKNNGILGSKLGRGGGYYLRKDPEEVNLAEIHRIFDGAIGLLPCVTYQYYEKCEECKDEETCGIREAILEVRNKTVEIMKENSLLHILEVEDEKKSSRFS
ncbi:MAG: Rrf2 family transcriptional regulator [Owenweeksia sp.]|nr:Rrf2 family transcriptional regulator [Owenweeksia sp.]